MLDDEDPNAGSNLAVDERVREVHRGESPTATRSRCAKARIGKKKRSDTLELGEKACGQCRRDFALVER